MLLNKKIIILIGLVAVPYVHVFSMDRNIDCKVAETVGDQVRLIGGFPREDRAFMRLLSLTEGVMAVAYADQMQLQIRKLPDAVQQRSSSAFSYDDEDDALVSEQFASCGISVVPAATPVPVLQQTIATLRSCIAGTVATQATSGNSAGSTTAETAASSSSHATAATDSKPLKRSVTFSSLVTIMRPYAVNHEHHAPASIPSAAAREPETVSLSQLVAMRASRSRLTAESHEDSKEAKEPSASRFNTISDGEDPSELFEHWSLQ